jgi:hypothetical protein
MYTYSNILITRACILDGYGWQSILILSDIIQIIRVSVNITVTED